MHRIGVVLVALVGCGGGGGAVAPGGSESSGGETSSSSESGSSTGASERGTTTVVDDSSSGESSSSSSSSESTDDGTATVSVEYCGNGELDEGEECDDANVLDGDACSSRCMSTFAIAWTSIYDAPSATPSNDGAFAITLDANDAIYVAGTARGDDESQDIWVRQYLADGSEGWTTTWNGADGLTDSAVTIALSEGRLFVGGTTGSDASGPDVAVVAIDVATQDVAWSVTRDGSGAPGPDPDDDRDDVRAIAIDPDGNVVVAARLRTLDAEADLWLAEYTADGVLRWEQSWDDEAAGNDIVESMRVTDDGRVYALVLSETDGGYLSFVLVYDDEGNPLLDETIDLTDAAAIVSDFRPLAGGDVLAAAVDGSGAIGARLDPTWEPVWATHSQGSAIADIAMAVAGHDDDALEISAIRFIDDQQDAVVAGFHADGSPWWGDAYDGDAHDDDVWRAVAVDSAGDVIVSGFTKNAADDYDAMVRKYEPL